MWGSGDYGRDDNARDFAVWSRDVLTHTSTLRETGASIYKGLTGTNDPTDADKRRAFDFLQSLAVSGRMRSLVLHPDNRNDGQKLWTAITVMYQRDPTQISMIRRLERYLRAPMAPPIASSSTHHHDILSALNHQHELALTLEMTEYKEKDVVSALLNPCPDTDRNLCPYWTDACYIKASEAVASDDPAVARDDATLRQFFEAGEAMERRTRRGPESDRTHQPTRIKPGSVFQASLPAGEVSPQNVCAFFLSKAGCSQGDACSRSHDPNYAKRARVCIDYLKGRCARDKCSFAHLPRAPQIKKDTNGANKSKGKASPKDKESSAGRSGKICYDFVRGTCVRSDCSYRHDKKLVAIIRDQLGSSNAGVASATSTAPPSLEALPPPTTLPPPTASPTLAGTVAVTQQTLDAMIQRAVTHATRALAATSGSADHMF